ncbi:Cytochrome cbb3 oxidase maturation protein CcoH [Croceitalea dokdonensis DOKDO 023]|uniref:Cytochrome cbb3 oxidase maturation protein CcoH n=1 Tax=Croceitalea dokdonensis DOKDO 023 TaxID=1300341 RepID=A0A0P7ARZ6_9FLAO|nr:FixH family protein [Croceitalea dokdonensis]KPM31249.1 Cytochrome cbb3 oxidase maturation protein CcoH [Croceitalea dokdonensis DOKDO 023]
MKVNWGTGIVLAFIGFISFILYFVVRMGMDDRANHDLVTDSYYKKELAYQDEIDAEANAAANNAQLTIKKMEEGVKVFFPKEFNTDKITGKVSLYRPSNRHLDFNFPISLSKTHLLIPDNRLLDGRWDITIEWKYKGKTFLHKEKISY